jgi:hypothetical protein
VNLRNITLPQALILIACVAGTICAYKFLGENAGHATMIVSMILNFMAGRPGGGSSGQGGGPDLKVIAGGAAGAMLLLCACGAALPAVDDPELINLAAKLSKCRTEARAYAQTSADPQSRETALAAYDVYQKCKEREGVK